MTGRGGGGGGGGDRAFSSASRPRPSTSETNLRKLAAGDGMARPGSALGLLQGNNSYLKKKTRETTVGISLVSLTVKPRRTGSLQESSARRRGVQKKPAAWAGRAGRPAAPACGPKMYGTCTFMKKQALKKATKRI